METNGLKKHCFCNVTVGFPYFCLLSRSSLSLAFSYLLGTVLVFSYDTIGGSLSHGSPGFYRDREASNLQWKTEATGKCFSYQ